VLLLAAPASAGAQDEVNAAPGVSAIDQYFETVPSASGPSAPGRNGGADPRTPQAAEAVKVLPTDVVRELQAAGPDGRKAAAVAAAGTPSKPSSREGDAAPAAVTAASGAEGKSPFEAITDVITGQNAGGSSGMGAALPLLLVLTTLAAIVIALRRRTPSP
jgi:hypothetical protein